jgi:hypothetical protein
MYKTLLQCGIFLTFTTSTNSSADFFLQRKRSIIFEEHATKTNSALPIPFFIYLTLNMLGFYLISMSFSEN